ncbi:pyridine nucleotide-disulfide oxidoreductase, partial [Enterococcus faecium]|nr:pyridine nucleotide-disulfide oxidoreductase [Enterococcus faecium]
MYQSVGKKRSEGKRMEKYQNIVIGFGKGGKTLAKALASKGESVLVVEKSTRMYGGTCINIGCIPS